MYSKELLKILIVGVLFVAIDAVYLTSISGYFNKQIRAIQNAPIQLERVATAICYAFLAFGIYSFIIREKRSTLDAFFLGAVIYMVYETTNKAILKDWKWMTVALDGVWGGILFALVTFLSYKAFSLLKL
jgi:uncharacterized membrane protein